MLFFFALVTLTLTLINKLDLSVLSKAVVYLRSKISKVIWHAYDVRKNRHLRK